MAENSNIEWTDHTVNFWIGCTKVSPACAGCYAEAWDRRFYVGRHWGPATPRMMRVEAAFREALKYQNKAEREGVRYRVFANSMSDFFEDRRDLDEARLVALDTIRRTPQLDWMVLTKRPDRIEELLFRVLDLSGSLDGLYDWLKDWIAGTPPANLFLGTTVEDQFQADARIPALLSVPARVHFVSMEPLLCQVKLTQIQHGSHVFDALGGGGFHETHFEPMPAPGRIDWVIAGGESGPHARPTHPDWFRVVRDQCASAGVPFLFKQWGEWLPDNQNPRITGPSGATQACKVGKTQAGRLLDGVLHDGYPGAI